MAKQDRLIDTLIETRGICGVYEVDQDGFLLGSIDAGVEDKEAIAAVAAVTLLSSSKIGEILKIGSLSWIMLEYDTGKMIIGKHEAKILVIVTSHQVPLGEIVNFLKGSHKSTSALH